MTLFELQTISRDEKYGMNGISALCAVVRLNYHFRGLTNLVELDLSQNGLKEVPSGAVIDCKYLMRLSLRGNPGIRHVRSLTQFLSVCFLFKIID